VGTIVGAAKKEVSKSKFQKLIIKINKLLAKHNKSIQRVIIDNDPHYEAWIQNSVRTVSMFVSVKSFEDSIKLHGFINNNVNLSISKGIGSWHK
jgi:hypothetical protein